MKVNCTIFGNLKDPGREFRSTISTEFANAKVHLHQHVLYEFFSVQFRDVLFAHQKQPKRLEHPHSQLLKNWDRSACQFCKELRRVDVFESRGMSFSIRLTKGRYKTGFPVSAAQVHCYLTAETMPFADLRR